LWKFAVPITSFDHFTVRCADLDAAWAFYRDALGMRVEKREFGAARIAAGPPPRAAIVYLEGEWLAHLFQATPEQDAIFGRMPATDAETAQWRTGRMHHIALRATGLGEMKARLEKFGAPYRERTLGDNYQIQVNDPDGVELEINFPAAEAG
jgi:catechol 2,3-dioxygenase-like lactoylglutathione lyase family enzyme